jgi:hypothetical protein
MVYCFIILQVFEPCILNIFLKVKIIEGEDVCVPKLSDWKKDSETSIQQLVIWF